MAKNPNSLLLGTWKRLSPAICKPISPNCITQKQNKKATNSSQKDFDRNIYVETLSPFSNFLSGKGRNNRFCSCSFSGYRLIGLRSRKQTGPIQKIRSFLVFNFLQNSYTFYHYPKKKNLPHPSRAIPSSTTLQFRFFTIGDALNRFFFCGRVFLCVI